MLPNLDILSEVNVVLDKEISTVLPVNRLEQLVLLMSHESDGVRLTALEELRRVLEVRSC